MFAPSFILISFLDFIMQNNFNKSNTLTDISMIPMRYVWLCSFLAIFFGFEFGVSLSNQQYFIDFYILGQNDLDVCMGTCLLGALTGCFLGSWILYSSGRKLCILSSAALGLVSITSATLAPNFSILLVSQFVIGFSFAIYLFATSIYICEIVMPTNRGLCVSLVWVFIFLGTMLAVLFKRYTFVDRDFTLLFIIFIFYLVLIIINFIFLPESPRWLSLSGFPDAALNTLFKLRKDMGIAARELAGINESCSGEENGINLFLQNSNYRRILWLLFLLTVFFHLSGFLFVPRHLLGLISKGFVVYEVAGLYDYEYGINKSIATVIFIASLCTTLTVDKIGREKVMQLSSVLMFFIICTLFVVSIYDVVYISSTILTALILIYIFASTVLFCCFIPLLLCELMPTKGREFGICVIAITNIVLMIFGFRSYRYIIEIFNFSGYFFISLLFNLGLIYIITMYVPNTSNASLEGIENRLFSGLNFKDLGVN